MFKLQCSRSAYFSILIQNGRILIKYLGINCLKTSSHQNVRGAPSLPASNPHLVLQAHTYTNLYNITQSFVFINID